MSALLDDRFSRIRRLTGVDAFKKLIDARVVVVGLGAVGSYATEALARAGVGNLLLVDFDKISVTNINRQLFALDSTVGLNKTDVAAQRVADINPHCNVTTLHTFVHANTMDAILESQPDIIIDAIDSLNPKIELLDAATRSGFTVISSMGAALRTDPLKVKISPLSQTRHCPLARLIRKYLRRRKANIDFTCVYSDELVSEERKASAIDREDTSEHNSGMGGRVRPVMGSLPTITGIFGLTAANTAIQYLLENRSH